MGLKTLLQDEIQSEMGELNKLEVGTDAYKVTVEGVTKLVDKAIELEKVEIERSEKISDRNINVDIQNERLKIERRDKIIGHVLTGVSLLSGAILTVWGTFKTLKFEETGTVTTFAGKKFFDKLFPIIKK